MNGNFPTDHIDGNSETSARILVLGAFYAAAIFFAVAFSPAIGFIPAPTPHPIVTASR